MQNNGLFKVSTTEAAIMNHRWIIGGVGRMIVVGQKELKVRQLKISVFFSISVFVRGNLQELSLPHSIDINGLRDHYHP